MTTTATTNGARVPLPDLQSILSIWNIIRSEGRRRRTQALLRHMRESGFEPNDGDWCVINEGLRDEFDNHPAFRYSSFVNGAVFLSGRLLGLTLSDLKSGPTP